MPLNVRDASQTVVESVLPAAVIVADAELRIAHAEGDVFGRRRRGAEEWVGRLVSEVLPADSVAELEPRYRAALAGEHESFDYWARDGRHAYWVQISPVHGERGSVTSVVSVVQDITEQLQTTMALARSEARLRDSERMIGVGSWELALADGAITYSRGFARLVGLGPGERLDLERCFNAVHHDDRGVAAAAVADYHNTGSARCELRIVRPDGAVRTLLVQGEAAPPEDGQPRFVRGAVLDVTAERESERDRLAAMSLFRQGFDAAPIGMVLTEPLEGSYVRVNDAMCRLLGRTREELLGTGIERVTHPDDRAGEHSARQAMLEGTATDFQTEKRYLLPDGSAIWATLHVAPIRNDDGSVRVFFSQIVNVSERKEHEAQLAHDVDDAVWLGRIRDAIDDDRMVLYSQPIVDLRTGDTVQRELLLRMRGEDGSMIAPGEFLPFAERYGLISEIDRWVIRQAVGLAAAGLPTEFNISGASIGDPEVLRELTTQIELAGADPALLVVEVTETAMMDHLDAGRLFAEQVTALGCGLALDDFGTGFGSLSYLKHIPAQHLKIDIEFVRELTRSETDERLVRGLVGFAHEFEQITIAEGIEDEATLAVLRELGVDRGQGLLFGPPDPLPGAVPHGPSRARQSPGCADPVAIVRAGFEAFAKRDLAAVRELCHPEIVLRLFATSKRANRDAPYRGHDGLRTYFNDVQAVWDELTLTPTAFWQTDGAVIAFGYAVGQANGETQSVDILWVCRLRNGLLASMDVFQNPGRKAGSAPRAGQPARQATSARQNQTRRNS